MSKIALAGAVSGTATFTIESPATSTNRTLTLPDNTGTIITQNSTPAFASTIGVGGATAAASGAGITFPATQSASSNANTLDDYEEGTWTPTVVGDSTAGTYTTTNTDAYYTKIGNLVTVFARIAFSAASGGTGYARITGLPFTYANPTRTAGSIYATSLNTTASSSNGISITPDAGGNNTSLYMLLTIDNASVESIAIGAISTSTNLTFTISYTV